MSIVHNYTNLFSSLNVIRIIKSRRMRWADHIVRMGRRGIHIGFWDGMDWIDLARDRDQWRAFVNEAMNLPLT
jgi:hypothetical protein